MSDAPQWRGDEYIYVQLADLFADKIARGEMAAGDRLPSELELAEQYGIARLTARRGVRLLVERGLVRTLPGKGTFVLKQDAGQE